jgi:hypothetical protein
MRDHQDVILGDRYIEFDRIDAEADRVLERGNRIFRPPDASAAVAVNLNSSQK